ncbi:hypothetical protein QL285_083688 [Trifolium repens]|nr:hypothetical protein QL285_083688 [Trifolium repens]
MAESRLNTALEAEVQQNLAVEAKVEEDGTNMSPTQRLDCIYDDEPLGFERDPINVTPKMQAQDPLEEIDIGNGSVKRPTYISANISPDLKETLVQLLKEFSDCFAWDYVEWLANIVPVIKKNGTLRVCIDFRDLNNATPKDEYAMPVAEMLVDSAAGFEFLSMLDGYSGYNQIFIAEEDVSKTAFRCPGALGTYEWVVMPFGLKNAGATYQRAMNSMFHDFIDTFMQVYIDDIIIKSSSEDSHLLYLRQSFERMRRHGLKMNPLKCAFCVHAGDFLGFVVHKKGIEINQNKTKAILETKPPSTKKQLQSLLGKINFLRRFISNLSGKAQAFSPLLRLKKDDSFKWNEEHQKAFDDIKDYLIKPPVLMPPSRNKAMKLYIAASEKTIGSMLAQEDDNGIENAVYYLSRVLNDAETRYTAIEKLCLCLYFSCTKLKHYIKPVDVYVYSHFDVIKHMLAKPILHSRIGKWALALTEYSLTYKPLKAVKGQIVADFIVDHSLVEMPQEYVDIQPWILYFDGSKHKHGTGIGILIISPTKVPTKFKYKINGLCSNNEVEYEALITGLEILKDLGAKNIKIRGDSELVFKQLTQEYKCVKEHLAKYFVITSSLLNGFDHIDIEHVPRLENQEANDLAQIASGYKVSKEKLTQLIEIKEKMVLQEPISEQLSMPKLVGADNDEVKIPQENFEIFAIDNLSDNDWRKPIVEYLRNPTENVDRKIKCRALSYIIFENDLFKKTSEGILLKCLNETEAYIAISDVHSGTCGSHQAGHKMKWLLFRQGLYWPSMLKGCIEYAKGCQECQRHSGIQHVPASELHSIVKPWPFRGWALDLIGEIKSASSKNQRYILVGIDYFTKWIEAIPLPNVDQEAVIGFIQNHIIYRFGIPETITTDQGSVFTGRKMQEFAQEIGFRLLTSTPYYAQANGQVEAANKIIINLIKKHIAQKPRNWHKTLDQVLWACRNSPKESTNTTPFRLTYGHDAVLPVEIHLQSARVQRQMEIPLDHYYQMMSDELVDLDEERLSALEVLARQKEKVARAYNKKVKSKSFNLGDLVWKVILPMDKKDRVLGKWSPNWEGPFKVVQVYSNGAYEIEELTPEKRALGINGKYLKKYKPALLEVNISAE